MEHKIVIVGATGLVGGEIVRQFAAAGQRVRALVRDEVKAATIEDLAEPVVGDLARPETLPRVFAGAERVFVLCPPVSGAELLEQAAFEAAAEAGARRIVFLSNYGAGELDGGDHFRTHAANEKWLAGLGVDWTVLRPTRFMRYTPYAWAPLLKDGVLLESGGDGQITVIDTEDVAAVARLALTEDGHEGQTYELTSADRLTAARLAEIIAGVLHRKVKLFEGDKAALLQALIDGGVPVEYAPIMVQYFAIVSEGRFEVTETVAELLGRPARSYAQWLERNAPSSN
jgi:uncharacterized protein YbjT (DUF2867 family)